MIDNLDHLSASDVAAVYASAYTLHLPADTLARLFAQADHYTFEQSKADGRTMIVRESKGRTMPSIRAIKLP